MLAVLVFENERDPAEKFQKPRGDNVDELVVVNHHDIAGAGVAQDVARVKQPGERQAPFGRVPVRAEELPVGRVSGFHGGQPFWIAPLLRFWRRREHDDFPRRCLLQTPEKNLPLGSRQAARHFLPAQVVVVLVKDIAQADDFVFVWHDNQSRDSKQLFAAHLNSRRMPVYH